MMLYQKGPVHGRTLKRGMHGCVSIFVQGSTPPRARTLRYRFLFDIIPQVISTQHRVGAKTLSIINNRGWHKFYPGR